MRVTARAPLRLGPAGGVTDLLPFCDLYGGNVLNVIIGLYARTIIEPLPEGVVELRATDIGVDESFGTTWTLPVSPPPTLESHRDIVSGCGEPQSIGAEMAIGRV